VEFSERIENLFEQYRRQRDMFQTLQQRIEQIAVTATSARQEVAVTVGHGGKVRDVQFPTNAYKRMTPVELSAVIMQTLTEARDRANDESAAIMEPMMPAGMNARDMLSGKTSPMEMLPAEPRIPNVVRERLGLGRQS
jgi:DNA-binding protein YbaB